MKIIKEIIVELVNGDLSLKNPLLKTKVLAIKLKNQVLLIWINRELTGYDGNDTLPNYRNAVCILKGNYINGNKLFSDQPLSRSGLSEELSKYMINTPLKMSVESIDSLLSDSQVGMLQEPLPAEVCHEITIAYQNAGNTFFQVLSAWKEFSKTSLVQALSEIRSKLLELMLELDEEFGNFELDDLISKKSSINKIIIENMGNNFISGDGNILNTGDNNSIISKIKIESGNIKQLKEALKIFEVIDEDINEIVEIVETEKVGKDSKVLGAKANSWIQKMIGKSLDGTWQVAVGTAGDFLANVLWQYFGH